MIPIPFQKFALLKCGMEGFDLCICHIITAHTKAAAPVYLLMRHLRRVGPSAINSTANNNGNQQPANAPTQLNRTELPSFPPGGNTHLACVKGIIVGGFGGCCGTIRPLRGGPRCGNEISPADLNEITPVLSRLFEKRTRPPCEEKSGEEKRE